MGVPGPAAPAPCAEKPSPEEDWSSQPVVSLCRVIVVSVNCDPWGRCQRRQGAVKVSDLCIAVGDSGLPGFAESNSHYLASCDRVNNREAGNLRRYRPHYEVTVMLRKNKILILRIKDKYQWQICYFRFHYIDAQNTAALSGSVIASSSC